MFTGIITDIGRVRQVKPGGDTAFTIATAYDTHDIAIGASIRVGDELGGHVLAGHVDAVAEIVSRRPEGDSVRYLFDAPPPFDKAIAPKGSVALDGVSLTVNEVDGRRFGVNIIPHTQAKTTFGAARPGDRVNLEIDVLARYVARILGKDLA